MTTGSVNRDKLITETWGPFGPVTGGIYYRKSWTGGDSLPRMKVSKQPKQFWFEDTVKAYYKYDRKKRKYFLSTKIVKVLKWRRPAAVRPPKPVKLRPNNYNLTILDANDPVVSCIQAPAYGNYSYPANVFWHSGGVTWPESWSAEDDYVLLERLKKQLQGSDFNAGVFLAEGRMALTMIFEAATRLGRAYRFARKGNLIQAARTLTDGVVVAKRYSVRKNSASNWLELQYGWLPLLGDIEAGAQFLAHANTEPFRQRVRVRYKKSSSRSSCPAYPAYRYASDKFQMKGQIVAELTHVDIFELSGLTDPASVAWELTPFSFVADWVLPIGDFLAARSTAQALKGTFVKTVTREVKASGYGYRLPPQSEYEALQRSDISALAGAQIKVFEMERRILSSLDVRLPKVKSFSQAFSWKRAANAVALLSKVVKL